MTGLRVALVAAGTYLGLFAVARRRVPFVPAEMFRFSVADRPTVVPVVWADGEVVDPERLTGFWGLSAADVDVAHRGYECSAEHKLYELQDWLRAHPGQSAGPVQVELGMAIIAPGPAGPRVSHRVDARGSAAWR